MTAPRKLSPSGMSTRQESCSPRDMCKSYRCRKLSSSGRSHIPVADKNAEPTAKVFTFLSGMSPSMASWTRNTSSTSDHVMRRFLFQFLAVIAVTSNDKRQHQEDITMKRILKHLRQRRLLTPLKFIQDRCKVQLEHPLVSQLFETLVLRGQFADVEQCLRACSDNGLFDSFIKSSQPRAHWKRITAVDADGDYPMKRGGHAMCIDSEKGLIYLHGGWDGTKNLDDYWEYDIANNRWKLLSQHTSQDKNGPGPRACHKMVFDQKTGCIYLLGKLGDEEGSRLVSGDTPETKPPGTGEQQFCSEFYRYRTRGIDHGNWELLNFDTAVCIPDLSAPKTSR